ncbi:hypothetical protein [Saccharicrinis aurantiacus]|uniref:hypothetical protein n=1 Tax=Saccharicrinis aurantiacus TaxID=1849719 RepID=UPI000839688D|nr:hypothetical protein [Saccharicrinis aurantiacus]
MNNYRKIGAIGFIIAGLLNVFRIFPILFTPGVTPEQIPPHTLVDTVIISQTSAYLISHIMALFATPLILIGFYSLFKDIKPSENSKAVQVGLLGLIGLFIGQLFYSIGLLIDGFTLPTLTSEYIASGANETSPIATVINGIHHLAMGFAGPGFFTLVISTGILGYALFKSGFNKPFAIGAIVIGILGIVGYSIGILDILIGGSFELTYGLLTMMYIFFLSIGIYQFRS